MSEQPFDQEHPRDEHGRFASERFDSDPFIRRAMPAPSQTELQRAIGQSAKLHRIASLNHLVRTTMNEARAALEAGNPDKALDILGKASGKYVRWGGETPYWKEEGK